MHFMLEGSKNQNLTNYSPIRLLSQSQTQVKPKLKPNNERRTSGSHAFKFAVPRAKKDMFKFSFFPRTINEWNSLPEEASLFHFLWRLRLNQQTTDSSCQVWLRPHGLPVCSTPWNYPIRRMQGVLPYDHNHSIFSADTDQNKLKFAFIWHFLVVVVFINFKTHRFL